MFCTIRAATPRRVVTVAPAGTATPFGEAFGFSAGTAGLAGAAGFAAGTVGLTGATVVAAGASVPARFAVAVAFAAVASAGVTIGPAAVAGL